MTPTEYPDKPTLAALKAARLPRAVTVWRVPESTMQLLKTYHAEGLGGWQAFRYNHKQGYARNDGATTTVFIADH
jgi:hypothetical protein